MKYLTFVDNINTFNLKNHQVLKLKFLPQNIGNGFTEECTVKSISLAP